MSSDDVPEALKGVSIMEFLGHVNAQEAFQQAYAEIQTTTDPCRYAYLKWIGYHMWKHFDYESGLEMIKKDWRDCKEWRGGCTASDIADAERAIKRRDSTGEPVTFPLKRGLFTEK